VAQNGTGKAKAAKKRKERAQQRRAMASQSHLALVLPAADAGPTAESTVARRVASKQGAAVIHGHRADRLASVGDVGCDNVVPRHRVDVAQVRVSVEQNTATSHGREQLESLHVGNLRILSHAQTNVLRASDATKCREPVQRRQRRAVLRAVPRGSASNMRCREPSVT
jgi:hypothetical protein